ncbi:uncharacterized protein LOC103882502 isoform X3 [Papio anubis]|uniref:uncharacterized protein LOC103882502 isoform X3 n=1 Tax=Papio anubis TaxID=9555 RepID=UPI0012ADBE5F|nr:uncharacterized protein LOC103882502 isoform X3 [Papio anubis]
MFRRRWNGGGSPRWLSAGVPRNEAMKVKAQLDNRSVRRTRRKGIEGVDETRSWDPDEKERGNVSISLLKSPRINIGLQSEMEMEHYFFLNSRLPQACWLSFSFLH